jgi:SAM-dependent methyltransferase
MPSNVFAPVKALDFSHRAQLSELMDEPCTREQLRACLRDVSRLNRWFLGYRPLFAWLNSFLPPSISRPLHILDVGCGNGDALRRIERWAANRRLAVELTGVDINPNAIDIAAELTPARSCIQWAASDIFAFIPEKPFDLVISTLFTHHLSDHDIVPFFAWMEKHAMLGWFINDLSRAAVPYHLLGIFTKLARLHPFVQHDGPVSIARAFVIEDWQRICAAAGFDKPTITIRPFQPARLCVARRKP